MGWLVLFTAVVAWTDSRPCPTACANGIKIKCNGSVPSMSKKTCTMKLMNNECKIHKLVEGKTYSVSDLRDLPLCKDIAIGKNNQNILVHPQRNVKGGDPMDQIEMKIIKVYSHYSLASSCASITHELVHACDAKDMGPIGTAYQACDEVEANQIELEYYSRTIENNCRAMAENWIAPTCDNACDNIAYIRLGATVDQSICQLSEKQGGKLTRSQCQSALPPCSQDSNWFKQLPIACQSTAHRWWADQKFHFHTTCEKYWQTTSHDLNYYGCDENPVVESSKPNHSASPAR